MTQLWLGSGARSLMHFWMSEVNRTSYIYKFWCCRISLGVILSPHIIY